METQTNNDFIEIDKMSIDQAAGAFVMIAGAIGSLLLVIWQSKCHCKMNLCYIFQCERRPPNEDEMKGLKEQAKKLNKKEDEVLEKEDEILKEVEEQTEGSLRQKQPLSRQSSFSKEGEPGSEAPQREPESIIP
jgi:hypothetical protein